MTSVSLLGVPQLGRRTERPIRLERKTALLLAYLALEGESDKYRLGGLLWPESPETAARNNMRQLLRRLRAAAGEELIGGQQAIALREDVDVDVRKLEAAAFAGRHPEVLAESAELLGGCTFDDCPELDDWLGRAREQLTALRVRAFAAEVRRLSDVGDLQAALTCADGWARLEPLSEEAAREQMQLQALLGNRTGALLTFGRLRDRLSKELGVQPEPETARLAQQLERGEVAPVAKPSRALPLEVIRPPVLAGRKEAWDALEAGWQAGQFLLVAGEGGAGKSRLVRDFAGSKGRYLLLDGRPGDLSVPFSSMARGVRGMIAQCPGVELPEWARREVTRLLPELLLPGEQPPPLTDEASKLRFFDAQGEVLIRTTQELACVVIDDVHFFDAGSVEVAQYLLGKHFPFGRPGGLPRFIDCFRSAELPLPQRQALDQMSKIGLARQIDLSPLSSSEVGELLGGLSIPQVETICEPLWRYTGGNPLFIVETIKHLLETGGLARGWPGRFPPPGKVLSLVQQRLELLSADALRIVQLAALAETEFNLGLAAEVLGRSPIDLAAPMAELESALILRNEKFVHDLLYESVRAGVPGPLRKALHVRLAEALQDRGAPAARVAGHWLEANETRRAIPLLLEAAAASEAALQPLDAAEHYARARALQSELGEASAAAEAARSEARCREGALVAASPVAGSVSASARRA